MIVLDSSFLIAYHNTHDVHHANAVLAMEDVLVGKWGRSLLLEYVFLEVVTVLLLRRGLSAALSVATILLQARELDFVPCSEVFLATLDTFRTQGDGTLSFVDAAIVTVARRQDVGLVATFDRDFQGIKGIRMIPG